MTTTGPTARTRAVLVVLTALASLAAMLVPATGPSAVRAATGMAYPVVGVAAGV